MPTQTGPCYELPAEELARWVERQGDQWWSVDGDPELMGRIPFPCPGTRLAAELRKVRRPLFVSAASPHAGPVDAAALDGFVSRLADAIHMRNGAPVPAWANDRVLTLRWNTGGDWLLSEDTEAADRARRYAGAGAV